jgi:glycosyltransferase involved in cell wall biosynthesis
METLVFLMTSTFLPPQGIGGADLHVKNLADELTRLGHEVHVLHSADAYGIKKGAYRARSEHVTKTTGEGGVHTYAIKTPFDLSAYVTYLLGDFAPLTKKFEKLVNKIKPDVVHHHEISLLGYRILKKVGDYLNLYTAHDHWLICQNNTLLKNGREICGGNSAATLDMECFRCALSNNRPPQIWRRTCSFREAIREIDLLLAPSNYMKIRLIESIGSLNVVVIPNFVPEPPRRKLVASGFSDFFLYAGRLEKYKGIIQLIDSFRELDSKLVIAGDGPLSNRVDAMSRANGPGGRITFLGHTNHDALYSLIRDANAVIIPSVSPENAPLIALEALSVGTPVIAMNSGGLPEIVERIDESLIFDSFAQLSRIIANFDKNRYPSDVIKGVYESYYSPRSYEEAYMNAIAKNRQVHSFGEPSRSRQLTT